MTTSPLARRIGLAAAAALLLAGGGCSSLRPAPVPATSFYALGFGPGAAPGAPAIRPGGAAAASTTASLIVAPPQAAPGFDSRRIIYTRQAQRLEYFARSEWVDTPARMLAPLIVAAVEATASFQSVAAAASTATGDLRLDTQVIRLQHEFGAAPSRVRITLRATLLSGVSGRVVASREFDESAPAAADDAYSGVLAANEALRKVLLQLAAFCAEVNQAAPGVR